MHRSRAREVRLPLPKAWTPIEPLRKTMTTKE